MNKQIFVSFADEKIRKAYEHLKKENPKLYKFIDRATDDLKIDLFAEYQYKRD